MTSRLALLLFVAHALVAQFVLSTRAGTVHFLTGEVLIDGKPAVWTPLKFPQLAEGQVLSTANGRAEILLGPGVFLRLGEHASVRMLNTRLEDADAELLQGTALVEVVEMPKGSDVHLRLGATRTGFRGIGLHRFDAASSQLRVFGGHADVVAGSTSVEATRGKIVHLNNSLSQTKFNPRKNDRFSLWAAQRSFYLYRSNPLAALHQTNWEVRELSAPTWHGDIVNSDQDHIINIDRDHIYFFNRDFDVMFYGLRGISFPAGGMPPPANPPIVPPGGGETRLISLP